MSSNGKQPRSALLIRCTAEEAAAIRSAAKLERRTVSAFVVRAVMNRISVRRQVESGFNALQKKKHNGEQSGDGIGSLNPKQVAAGLHSAL